MITDSTEVPEGVTATTLWRQPMAWLCMYCQDGIGIVIDCVQLTLTMTRNLHLTLALQAYYGHYARQTAK
jgi:hypothetical protein